MKKLIALLLLVAVVLSLAGCCCCPAPEPCDLCGEVGFHTEREIITGSRYPVCDDCWREYSNWLG